jgi:hypothetical protein
MKKTDSNFFPLGQTVITRNALNTLDQQSVLDAMLRHARCDWGDVTDQDREENNLSLREGFRLFSVYNDSAGIKFYIITEADRSATTVLLPEDY